MVGRILNRIGLALGIVGVIIIFIWGPPQPALETGVSMGLELGTIIDRSTGKTVAQYNQEVLGQRKVHTTMSAFGLAGVGFGFLCQFFATFLVSTKT